MSHKNTSKEKQAVYIHWFRQDLRLRDNLSLTRAWQCTAKENSAKLLPVYILDEENAGSLKHGGASRWWLSQSLANLDKELYGLLSIYKGDAHEIICKYLMQHFLIKGVFWNRCYEPWHLSHDNKIEKTLKSHNIEVKSFNSALLWEPWDALKKDGTPYRVFTPFYKNGCLDNEKIPREPLAAPSLEKTKIICHAAAMGLNNTNLLPQRKWAKKLEPHWHIGEQGAQECLEKFIQTGLGGYEQGRNYPARTKVSRLSPYLHFGEISPHQIREKISKFGDETNPDIKTFIKELIWREFSYNILYHEPYLPEQNLQSKFDNFPWQNNQEHLKAWQKGMTGYPIVDAGMRELWQTGYMHNRVRMIVGSFLVKNLMLHWRHGFKWFWDCLVDADLANNAANWQWVAGCGADAAPYFRIFNPVTQSKKFDPEGTYIKRYIPELKKLSNKEIHEPWNVPVSHKKDYPEPIVDLKASRERALVAFQSLKKP
ncbi:MAG: cryptochrome/photolyase family protein [Alphaproteobacteria bacterium]